ncbi:YciI family protein [Streptomyces polyrhachis]|uniref:YciI family protein n=1 Tax=Streptomyces polyrhachis TaxID=1282885 RepID=A0ABW2GN57_9ACTN
MDTPGLGDEMYDLAEEHWSSMDRFADRLVLRGPTLSEDGEEHTGSVHVVEAADRAAAERFADGEPYWRAGLYRKVTAFRAVVLLDRALGRP